VLRHLVHIVTAGFLRFHLTELNSSLHQRGVKKPYAPEEAVTECTEVLCRKASRKAQKSESVDRNSVCVCVCVCVCLCLCACAF